MVAVIGKCKDCPPEARARPVRKPGPRCATHARASRNKRRTTAWSAYILRTYRLTEARYWKIYEAQGGACAGCRRATGKVKRLSVDHDHACCSGPTSCGQCVRGLLCTTCNKFLGHVRDNPELLIGLAGYLVDWPARRVQ